MLTFISKYTKANRYPLTILHINNIVNNAMDFSIITQVSDYRVEN